MTHKPNSSHPRFVRFRIEASRCGLRVGDAVSPETVLGVDAEDGKTVTAGCHGVVEAVDFMGGEHVLYMIIRTNEP